MTALNQEAPPVEVKNNTQFFRFDPPPGSDSYVATVVGTNFIADYPFNRTDEKTKKKTVENGPGVEFFFGFQVDGKTYFAKSWPKFYSIGDRASYHKWYKALTGAAPTAKQRPTDMLGKHALIAVTVEDKVSGKGTAYKAVNIKDVLSVPKVLAATVIPLSQMEAQFKAALAKSSEKTDGGSGDTGNVPF